MAEQDDDQLDPAHEQLAPEIQALLREGRKAKRELAEAAQARTDLERQVAVEKAGIPESPMRELFLKAYEGPADAEAIKAEAEKYGLFNKPAEPVASGPTAEEMAAQRQVLNAGAGAPAPTGDVDLAVALRNAKSQAEVLAIVAQVQGQPGFKNRDGMIGVLPEY